MKNIKYIVRWKRWRVQALMHVQKRQASRMSFRKFRLSETLRLPAISLRSASGGDDRVTARGQGQKWRLTWVNLIDSTGKTLNELKERMKWPAGAYHPVHSNTPAPKWYQTPCPQLLQYLPTTILPFHISSVNLLLQYVEVCIFSVNKKRKFSLSG